MSTPPRLLLAEHTRVECRALAAAGAVVVLPIGATEQHGPHLPVGTDNLQVEHVVLEAAARADAGVPVLVAPTLPYGCSQHHVPFGGTASLSSETFLRVLVELGTTLARRASAAWRWSTATGGNHQLTSVAARDLALAHDVDVAACSWWHLAAEGAVAAARWSAAACRATPGPSRRPACWPCGPTWWPTSCRGATRRRTPSPTATRCRSELHGSWSAIDG